MNIVCLNIWGGRAGKELLLEFFRKYRDTADVFCLQEVWADKYEFFEGALAGGVPISHEGILTHALHDIGEILPDHMPYFHPSFYENYGLCTFVRKNISVIENGDFFVHFERGYVPEGDLGNHARNLQYVTVNIGGERRTIINIHGLWNGKGKGDSDDRLIQSDRILEFTKTLSNPFVLCGDFNVTPDTQSIQKIEKSGLRNLITEYGITSTRTSFYEKAERYADYAFVSEGIEVKHFAVLPDEVSDHAALYISISN